MEQIRVNMTPNNEVKTIHCSKGDGNTRKWGFQLYKEDGAIDASSISPQMFFDSYKGGTEQILPENTSIPTTSPIIADIQYKDALRSEQEFLYRESPATVDGKAKITKIKGNTLVWNQLVQNGNFADGTDKWNSLYGSISVNNGVLFYTVSTSHNAGAVRQFSMPVIEGHKYYLSEYVTSTKNFAVNFYVSGVSANDISVGANIRTHVSAILNVVTVSDKTLYCYANRGAILTQGDIVKFENIQMFDLTLMGIDSLTTTSEVEAWLSSHIGNLPYYDHTPGMLIPFKGTGIKTIGRNQWIADTLIPKKIIDNGVISDTTVNGTWISDEIHIPSGSTTLYLGIFAKAQYSSGSMQTFASNDGVHFTTIGSVNNTNQITDGYKAEYSIPSGSTIIRLFGYMANNIDGIFTKTMSLGISFTELSSYEPYIESTTPLIVSDYFPTGMKSAGSVYDELTENKAITRIGSRAYESGDENDTTVITDGTTTYYPLTTPTETDITTASLVTDNGETPLYCDDDILKANCLTALSNEAGIFDAKIKLMDDETVYSQKIQLHVERKP